MNKRKNRPLKIFLMVIGAFIVILVILIVVIINPFRPSNPDFDAIMNGNPEAPILSEDYRSRLNKDLLNSNPAEKAQELPVIVEQKLDLYQDILILGIDSSDFNLYSNTDAILLARLDKQKNRLKLVSFSRDIYVNIPGYFENRLNEACVYGGPKLVLDTVNGNFGLNIKNYILFDFKGAEKIIDLLGGIEVDVDKDEVPKLAYVGIKKAGTQELNSKQAVYYARLRPDKGSDITRTGRQRKVMMGIVKKAKKIDLNKLLSLIPVAFDTFKTNMSVTELPGILTDFYKSIGNEITELALPVQNTFKEEAIVEMKFLVVNFKENINSLNAFLNN